MASLGSPQTSKYMIGTFEVRVGPLSQAGRLTQANSIGVIENFSLRSDLNTVDLMAGFPRKPVDTALTSAVTGLTATLREYSKRNLQLLWGGPAQNYPSPGEAVASLLDTASEHAAGETTIELTAFSDASTVVTDDDGSSSSGTSETNWTTTTGWAHNATDDRWDHTASNTGALTCTIVSGNLTVGQTYEVWVQVEDRTAGYLTVSAKYADLDFTADALSTFSGRMQSNRIYKLRFVAKKTTENLVFTPSSAFDGAVSRLRVSAFPGNTWNVGDLLTIYDASNPANVTVARITDWDGVDTVEISPGLSSAIAAGATAYAYRSSPITSSNYSVNYLSASLVQIDRASGKPMVFDFWKAAIAGGMQMSGNVTDFASTDLVLNVLKPAAAEYASGGALEHLATTIAAFPTWRFAAVAD